MKNRLIGLLLAIVMLLAAIPTVRAAKFSDTAGHWAEKYIDRVTNYGLFGGLSDTVFAPDETMTRGMFVTVLGRLEQVDLTFWQSDAAPHFFKDVPADAYYAPYVSWAVCNGITNGTGADTFSPDAPVTREQMARLVACYAERMNYDFLPPAQGTVIPDSFKDVATISAWAKDSVELLRKTAILNGSTDAQGNCSFQPKNTATRAQCATVFCRIADSLRKPLLPTVLPTGITLNESELKLNLGQSVQLKATLEPATITEYHLVWFSSDTAVVTVDATGKVICRGKGIAEVGVYTGNGLSAICSFNCDADYPSADDTYEEKCLRVFGEVVSDPRTYYATREAAQADMQDVTIPVWDINSNGEKYTKHISVTVHKSLADTVLTMFTEIYNGKEKFPIHYVGGWGWVGRSEHTIGCAIDINAEENYYCDADGNALVGKYWKPGEDPYSIPLDGEVATILAKYGFRQGVGWQSGYKDYMHFSFFGT